MEYNNRFTVKAETALNLAQQCAAELGQNYVGSEHLLLGLIREGTGVAARQLAAYGVTEAKVIAKITAMMGIEAGSTMQKPLGLTPRTKHILEYSVTEANQTGSKYIGTEHLLMALIREGESVAVNILVDLGLDISNIYNEIIQVSTSDPSSPTKPLKGKSTTPVLDQFSRDLTVMAKEGKIDPVIGRDKEIERIIQILSRRTKNNPCLIGEAGVGKTAIAEGLAQKIIDGGIPDMLKNKRVVTFDIASMIAGSKYRGEFEERIKKAIKEITESGDIILFIDEIHTIVGAGAAEGAIDAANILKPFMSRGEIQVVGATTINEYRKYIEKDPALERRFQSVLVDEPTEEEAIRILMGIRDKYEAHHDVKITDEAIEAAVTLSKRYIPDRFLPDKAIDLIDEASSKSHLRTFTPPENIQEMEAKIEQLTQDKEAAVCNQDYEKAAKLRDDEQKSRAALAELRAKWEKSQVKTSTEITVEDIAEIISSSTNIPLHRLSEDEGQRLLNLEEELHRRVIGQEQAVSAVAKAVRRGRMGLKDPKRPIGSFMFLGPTGVGKTELSKALAEALFGDEDGMIRIDMSELMEKHAVSRLVGSPPGYVGYDEGGQLTERVRRKPYSVVLFDEVEKAHPDVFNIILQVLEDGILTDSQGRRVDFRNTVIILTSNVGAKLIADGGRMGFVTDDNKKEEDYKEIKSRVMGEVKHVFKPEFLNRFDELIVFSQLSRSDVAQIGDKMLDIMKERLAARDIKLEFTKELKEMLVEEGYDAKYGARPMRRVIQTRIEDFIAEAMLNGKVKEGSSIKLGYDGENVTL